MTGNVQSNGYTQLTNPLGLVFNRKLIDIIAPRDFVRLRYDNEVIFFGHGADDVWCAYTGKYDAGIMYCAMPSDKYYFKIIRDIADACNCHEAMYEDFSDLCRRTGKLVDPQVVEYIGRLADGYGPNGDVMYNMFFHVYYGMVAEENKAYAHLGKSIKMLGLHDLLIKRKTVDDSADCNRGGNWRNIYADCQRSGITYLLRKG